MSSWVPVFRWDNPSTGDDMDVHHTDPIYDLFQCLRDADGYPVTMDDNRQTKTQRRPSKNKIQEDSNNGINLRAAKMTKCIVNYMNSGAETAKIIEYGADFRGKFDIDLLDLASDADTANQTWGKFTNTGTSDMIGDREGTADYVDAGNDYVDYRLEQLEGLASYDIDESIYEDLYYVAAPPMGIDFNIPITIFPYEYD